MKLALLFLCALAPTFSMAADEVPRENLQFPNTDLRDVLSYYEAKSKRPVYLALNVPALGVTMQGEKLTREEALDLIRNTLLEKYGIELRETADGVTLARKVAEPRALTKEEKAELERIFRKPQERPRARVIFPRPAPGATPRPVDEPAADR